MNKRLRPASLTKDELALVLHENGQCIWGTEIDLEPRDKSNLACHGIPERPSGLKLHGIPCDPPEGGDR